MSYAMAAGRGLIDFLRRLLGDERGFLRLYLSPDGEDGGGAGSDDAEDDDESGSDDSKVREAELTKARDQAAKARIKARQEREEREKLQAQLDALKKGRSDDDAAVKDAERKAAEERANKALTTATDRLKLAEFKQAAIDAGIRSDRVNDAFKLADLAEVDVDLDAGTVEGIEDAARAVADAHPEWSVEADKKPTPGVATGAPGSSRGQFDPKNVRKGDIAKLSDPEFDKLIAEGVIVEDELPNGEKVRMSFHSSDNELVATIRSAQQSKLLERLGLRQPRSG